ncbi:NAD(P)-dependent oxidoreductase [Bacillus sp. RAR_GA_16]|nr:NAD(P)-dependent oxidoreductase [Bacillus sp. RAR_GA_16]
MKVTFIGMGVMGSAMATNLLHNGIDLTIWNRTKDKVESLINKGALYKESPHEAVKEADIVFTMLTGPEAVDEVALSENGFLQSMKNDALWIDSSTVNPSFSKKANQLAHNVGVRFVDAPVAGSKGPAQKGELVFLVGGEKTDINQIEHFLQYMGKKIIHVGPVSQGTSFKMVVNMMLASNMAAFAESMILGEQLGLSKDFLLETLPGMPVSAPFLQMKADKLKVQNDEEEFALKNMQKDLHLATLSAYEENAALKITNLMKEVYADAKVNGYGDLDFSSIYSFYKQLHRMEE